jgi:hypothetical protein
MFNSNVKVTGTESGQVVIPSDNNTAYAHVRVTQKRNFVDDRGWLKKKELSALILGETTDLTELNLFTGQELPGKIVIKESLFPFNVNNPEKDYKFAGDTGVVCCLDGQPIYRKAFYDETGKDEDVFIKHNNGSAIKAASAKVAAKLTSSSNEMVEETGFTL